MLTGRDKDCPANVVGPIDGGLLIVYGGDPAGIVGVEQDQVTVASQTGFDFQKLRILIGDGSQASG